MAARGLDKGLAPVYGVSAMDGSAAQHQTWFAYYFSPPALLVGGEVLSR